MVETTNSPGVFNINAHGGLHQLVIFPSKVSIGNVTGEVFKDTSFKGVKGQDIIFVQVTYSAVNSLQ